MAPQQTLLPTGALLLAGTLSLPLAAQTTPAPTDTSTVAAPQTVTVTGHLGDKNTLRATDSTIGKGRQNLRDIPQSVTVLTEKLMDDRNLETVKEALKMTAGISFLAAEGGEEDVRLRGFSLQATGDVFVDGIRDPAFYERDTFNLERLEVMRGSASMLFGRGSTGGAVNQVSKTPRLLDENQVDVTLGSHAYRRVVGDINRRTGPSAALRLTAMHTQAQDNGTGTAVDKSGLAAAYRFGIGERNEFSASVYALDNRNGMNYGLPWIRPTATSSALESTVLPLDPATYFGMASDRNHGSARLATVSHLHRFDDRSELKTVVRAGRFTRDQRASAIRLGDALLQGGVAASLATFGPQTVLTRGTNLKIQDLDTLHAQSDFSRRFQGLGLTHELLAGVDAAVEDKTVYAARTTAQGGVVPGKANTLAGTPSDGATVDEDTRVLRVNNQYRAKGAGAYLQDLITLAPHWKVLAGLRYDRLVGDYQSYGNPPNAVDNGPLSAYRMTVGEWSKRAGLLYQPSERHAFHASAATSFNTSGDAYSLGASNVDTPPEQSLNLEVGGRIDSADKRFTTRFALFRSTKMNERNTDPLLPAVTLSGRRHVSGVEVDVAGKLAPGWEVFGSLTWLPDARVDRAAPCPTTGACSQGAPGEREGDRPALTPRYSGTIWTTLQAASEWRVGGGLNFRGRQTPTRAEFEVPAFVTADLMVEFAQSEQLRWKLNVSNVSNTLYADQLYPAHYVPGAGRLWQLTGSYQF